MSVLVHKAVEPGNLSVAGKKRLTALLANPQAIVQPKYDGVYVQFLPTPRGYDAFSRTGEHLSSIPASILEDLDFYGQVGRQYMGEVWLPNTQHSVLNGLARKKSVQPGLGVVLFDSYHPNHPDEPYTERLRMAGAVVGWGPIVLAQNLIYSHGGTTVTMDSMLSWARLFSATANGSAYDGLMLKDPDGKFKPGSGKDGESIKIKPRKSGDFRVIGAVEGKGKAAGMAGALVLALGGGVTCEVGTGMDDATRQNYWDWFRAGPGSRRRIAEIEYLDITKDGKLREPSFKSTRWDKTVADVLPGNIKGED